MPAPNSIVFITRYDANGGSGAPAGGSIGDGYSYGKTLYLNVTTSVPSRSGYSFMGWATSSSATSATHHAGERVSHTFYSAGTYTMSFYAVWARTYTVTYNLNGGSGSFPDQTKTHGVTLKLNSSSPTKSGYTFANWNTYQYGTGTVYSPGQKYTENKNLTLWAQWSLDAVKPVFSNGWIGSTLTITLNAPSGVSPTYNLTYSYNDQKPQDDSGVIATGISGSSYTWTPPYYLIPLCTNSKTATLQIWCTTYLNGTKIGVKSATSILSTPENSSTKPSIDSFSISSNIASKYSSAGINYIQNVSRLTATASSSAKYSSKITGINVVLPNAQSTMVPNPAAASYTGTTTFTAASLSTSGNSLKCKFSAIDTRGFTSAVSEASFNVTSYTSPILSNVSIARQSGNENKIDVKFKSVITSLSSQNTKKVTIKYKELPNGSWQTPYNNSTLSSYSNTFTYTIPSGSTTVSGDKKYDVQLTISDDFNSSTITKTVQIVDSFIIDVNPLKSISFHQIDPGNSYTNNSVVQRIDNWFDHDVRFRKSIYADGDTYGLGSIGNYSYDVPSAVSLANNTWAKLASISLSVGTYVVCFGNIFGNNGTGYRRAKLSTQSSGTSDPSAYTRAAQAAVNAVDGTAVPCTGTCIIKLTSATTLYLWAWQNSGASISNNWPFIYVTRVKGRTPY